MLKQLVEEWLDELNKKEIVSVSFSVSFKEREAEEPKEEVKRSFKDYELGQDEEVTVTTEEPEDTPKSYYQKNKEKMREYQRNYYHNVKKLKKRN